MNTQDNTENLAIRTRPKPVRRINRKALLVGTTGLSVLMFGALGFALQSPAADITPSTELYNITHKPVAESIQALPSSYADIPKLGPPLPGDLGQAYLDKPYLSSQQTDRQKDEVPDNPFQFKPEQRATPAPKFRPAYVRPARPVQSTYAPSPNPAENIRTAGLFFSVGGQHNTGAQSPVDPYAGLLDPAMMGLLPSQSRIQAQMSPQASVKAGVSSPYSIQAGTLIPASLITGINSDLPGPAMAQVTQNIFDSRTGQTLLIPQGSKLLGKYGASNSYGQTRAHILWNRLIMPSGRSAPLDNLPAMDGQGYTGLTGKVKHHRGKVASGAALSSLLGIGAELATGSEDRIIRALQASGGNTVNMAGQRIVDKSLNIKPTIIIAPGTQFSVMLTSDLPLQPYQP